MGNRFKGGRVEDIRDTIGNKITNSGERKNGINNGVEKGIKKVKDT